MACGALNHFDSSEHSVGLKRKSLGIPFESKSRCNHGSPKRLPQTRAAISLLKSRLRTIRWRAAKTKFDITMDGKETFAVMYLSFSWTDYSVSPPLRAVNLQRDQMSAQWRLRAKPNSIWMIWIGADRVAVVCSHQLPYIAPIKYFTK